MQGLEFRQSSAFALCQTPPRKAGAGNGRASRTRGAGRRQPPPRADSSPGHGAVTAPPLTQDVELGKEGRRLEIEQRQEEPYEVEGHGPGLVPPLLKLLQARVAAVGHGAVVRMASPGARTGHCKESTGSGRSAGDRAATQPHAAPSRGLSPEHAASLGKTEASICTREK